MRTWASLTWQVDDPATRAADIARRLGTVAAPDPRAAGCYVLDLGLASLGVVPWRREGPTDDAVPGGRLAFEPVLGGEAARRPETLRAVVLAGVGWATVELDRAEGELAEWLAGPAPDPADDIAEPLLGARARVRDSDGLPGDEIVLLEPATEGRLAASLARDGEGPCALFLWPSRGLDAWLVEAAARGVSVSARAEGPFGPSALVAGPAGAGVGMAGPHLIVVERLWSRTGPPGTIAG